MYQQERLAAIMSILKKTHYATVDYLAGQIHYSPASIRRDLTMLEKQGRIKRSYGGAEIMDEGAAPYRFRLHSMKTEKNKIAQAAAELINNGDTVFLDASTTVQYMGSFILHKKDICVITNNMTLAAQLAEGGIQVYCSGGYVCELPGTLSGTTAAEGFSRFCADIMFFSTDGIGNDGTIYVEPEGHYIHNGAMLRNSKKHVFLCGSDKIGRRARLVQCGLDSIDCVISNGRFDSELTGKYDKTQFICTE